MTTLPDDLGVAGTALWEAVTASYELEGHERVLLARCCRVEDALDALQAAVLADGAVVDGRPHPALVEARQQALLLARLLTALRLPVEGADGSEKVPSPRHLRGVYAPKRGTV
jgi:hypothetical protein